jgi:hypothetical protein
MKIVLRPSDREQGNVELPARLRDPVGFAVSASLLTLVVLIGSHPGNAATGQAPGSLEIIGENGKVKRRLPFEAYRSARCDQRISGAGHSHADFRKLRA